MMKGRQIAAACAVLLLSACGEPLSREQFIRSDGTGEYSFTIELPDTASTYDLSFYTSIVLPVMEPDTLGSFPMQVLWQAPSGRYFSETVYYPADSVRVSYRRGFQPSEAGSWTIQLDISPEPAGLRGMGLVISRNQ